MATSKESQSKLFVIHGIEGGVLGPDITDLGLCFAGRKDYVIFPVAGRPAHICGHVLSLTNMSELSYQWTPAWAQKGQRWSEVKIELDVNSQKIFDVKQVTIHYCSGPSSKDHWGIFSTGNMTTALDNLREEIFRIFRERSVSERLDMDLAVLYGNHYFSLFLRESSKSMACRIGRSTGNGLIHFDHWSQILIGLDFMTWTISARDSTTPPGKWKSRKRIYSYPHEPKKILNEAYEAFLLAKRDEKN
jgi:hypothetical protein